LVVGAFALCDAGVEEIVHPDASDDRAGRAPGLSDSRRDPRSIPEEILQMDVALARERQDDPDAPAAFLDAARSIVRLGKRPDVAARAMEGVHCPVLLLHGRHDRFVPAAFAEATLRRFPTWRGRIFPDLGHAPQMEAPGRWLAEVADWYSERVT
jgi:pimeloyl-ACP methyl ester carboxylesterase